MKAIHVKTNTEFHVVNIMGEKVHLRSMATGRDKKVEYQSFKADYRLADESEVMEPLTTEEEVEKAAEEAEAILNAFEDESNKVTVDFGDESTEERKKPRKQKILDVVDGPKPTTLKEICDELKMDPSKARKILRKELSKPSGGWEWTELSEVEMVKAVLKK